MTERYSSFPSKTKNADDDQLLDITTTSAQGQERILVDILDEPIVDINSPDNKDSETQELLAEYYVRAPTSGTIQCSKAPARYIIALWAFFGFFCLYAMRVNLSVAIVAMVRVYSI